MSVTFFGRTADGSPIHLDIEDPNHLNMSSANARTFLLFLGLDPGPEPAGEITIYEARRAIIRARATFERRVDAYVRGPSDTRQPGMVRVIVGGVDATWFERGLTDFDRFVAVVGEMGGTAIYWS